MKTPRWLRVIYIILTIFFLLFIIILIGMVGFYYIVKLDTLDSFYNSCFYVSGMGPVASMETPGQKIFASLYSLLAGIFFLGLASYLVQQIAMLELI